MSKVFSPVWLRFGVVLLLILFGNSLVFAQSCSIQSNDPSPVCQSAVVTYTVVGLPPLATQVAWVTPGGTQMTQGNSIAVHWEHAVTTTVTANLFDNTGAPLGFCTLGPVVVQETPAPVIVPNIPAGCGDRKEETVPSYCEHTALTFNANGDGGTYSWQVAGNAGLISSNTGNSIEVLTGNAGFFTITLTETSSGGCTAHTEAVYDVVLPPIVSFTELTHLSENPIEICRGESLLFLGTVTDPANLQLPERIWQVYNNAGTLVASGLGDNFSHEFFDPGTFTVTYLVSNCAGCVGSHSVDVIVSKAAVPNIICPSIVCQNGPSVEYCTDAACTDFNWTVTGGNIVSGQGTACIEVVWITIPPSGYGSVTLNTDNCAPDVCSEPVSIEVPILTANVSIAGLSSICDPDALLGYNLPDWPGAVYSWSITNVIANTGTVSGTQGSNPRNFNITLNGFTGKFTIHAVVEHPLLNCRFEYDKVVIVGNYDIVGEIVYCSGEDVELSLEPALPAGVTATWQIAELAWTSDPMSFSQVTIPASVFSNSGTFSVNVTLNLTTGEDLRCTNRSIHILRAVDPVTQILGPKNICLNQQYTYTAVPGGGSIFWTATGGTVDQPISNPTSVTWTGAGPNYALTAVRSEFVTIEFSNVPGKECMSEPFMRSDFMPIPIPSKLKIYSYEDACADDVTTYTASYDGGTDYSWSINPALGSIVSGQGTSEVVIYWNVPLGSNNQPILSLTAIVCGQPLSTSTTVDIHEGPVPVINGPEAICEGSNAVFTATLAGGAQGATYTWRVENNGMISMILTTVPTVNVPASVLHAGAGIIRVTATSTAGCIGSGSDVFNFTVVANPNPGIFTPDLPLCSHEQPAPCTITLYGQDYSGVESTFSWTHNNAVVGTDPAYPANINPWDSPTGYGTYTLTVAHVYTEYPGLTCHASDDYEIGVPNCNPPPKVPTVFFDSWHFGGCGVVVVHGTIPNINPNQWNDYVVAAQWRVEDFAGTVMPNPKPITSVTGLHTTLSTFTQPGFYPVWLEVRLINQQTMPPQPFPAASASRQVIEIPVLPDFDWSASCGVTPGTYQLNFSDMSQLIPATPQQPGTAISSWNWTINGSPVSSAQDFSHTFTAGAAAQTYEVCLTVTSATVVYQPGMPYTCTICKTITIPAQPNVSITPATANVCDGTPIDFQANYPPGTILDVTWDFDDGSGSYVDNPTKTYRYDPDHNNYDVTATFTDNNGCIIVRNAAITVNENNLDGEILVMSGDCNSMALLTFQGTPPVESYLWSPGGATTPSLLVEQNGIYSLTVTDAETGCTYSPASQAVLVQAPFPAGVMGAQRICQGINIDLSVVPVPGYTFHWVSSTGHNETDIDFTIPASDIPANPNMVTVTVTAMQNGHACAVESVVIHIDPTPATPIVTYTFGCPPYPIELSAFDGANPAQPIDVIWRTSTISFLGYGSHITRFAPGTVTASIANEFGCVASTNAGLHAPPRINLLAGCYTLCNTDLNTGTYTLPVPPIINGPIVDWQWFHNGVALGSPAPPPVQSLPLTTALEGEIFLRIHKRFPNSNGSFTTCEFDSDIFCLEVEECEEECKPPVPTLRNITCLQASENPATYYVLWDYPADGTTMPCMYAETLPIHDADGNQIGSFTAIDQELLNNSTWHLEGMFQLNTADQLWDACWDIPFCMISTGQLCGHTTVCTDSGDPDINNEILEECEDKPCSQQDLYSVIHTICENDPSTPTTHMLRVYLAYYGLAPGPMGCNTYDVSISAITGTTVPPNQTIEIQNVTPNSGGNLFLEPVHYPQLDFAWSNEIATDIVCLQVVISYDDACNLPAGTESICTRRFCKEINGCGGGGGGSYNFKSQCRGFDGKGYIYTFEIELIKETTIVAYDLIPGQSSGRAVLTSCTSNVIQGVYYSPTPNPTFYEGIVVKRPDGSTQDYIIEGVMPYCGEGDGKGDGKEGGPRSILSELKAVQMRVVPNPATDQVRVQFHLPADFVPDQNAVVIHNSLGAEVLRQQLDEMTSGGVTLQLSDLPGGWYQVSLWHKTSRIATQKLVVMKP